MVELWRLRQVRQSITSRGVVRKDGDHCDDEGANEEKEQAHEDDQLTAKHLGR